MFLSFFMSSLDATDQKILEMLRGDARTPYTEIAYKLGVSDSTIHVRLQKLRDDGILKGFTININEELLGKKVHGLAMINVNLGHLEEVANQLSRSENISKVYETHGEHDLMVLIDAIDLAELRRVLMDIRNTDNITSTNLNTVLKIWK